MKTVLGAFAMLAVAANLLTVPAMAQDKKPVEKKPTPMTKKVTGKKSAMKKMTGKKTMGKKATKPAGKMDDSTKMPPKDKK